MAGPTGLPGDPGWPGEEGSPGADGDPSKTAVLATAEGITALHAMEGEEVLFKDVVTVPVAAHGYGSADVCPTFREVCEPNSLFVQYAFIPECSSLVGARIVMQAGRVWVECRASPAPRRAVNATLTVAGVRRGFGGVNLPKFSAEEMEINRRFYAGAYLPS